MTAPTNSNSQIATIELESLGFDLAIGWQQTVDDGQIARWRRGDLMATPLLEGRRLTVALTSASDTTIPTRAPIGAAAAAKGMLLSKTGFWITEARGRP